MTDKKRFILFLSAIGLFSFLLRSFRLFAAPAGIGLNEVTLLAPLPFSFHRFAFFFRFASVFASTVSVIVFSLAAYRKTKNVLIALGIAIAFAIAPWSFIYARYINFTVWLVLYLGVAYLLSESWKRLILFAIPLLLFALGKPFSMLFDPGRLNELSPLTDLTTLFFAGDQISTFLRTPITGYFLLIDIPALILGCYVIATDKTWRNTIPSLTGTTAIALLYFFLNPQLVPAERSGLLLACMTVIIGAGYSVVLETGKKNKLVPLLFILTLLANLFFYQELFHNHFDRRNSTEWGYAEMSLVRYLDGHKSIKTVYITTNKEYLNTYLAFFLPRIKRIPLTENMIPKTCAEGYNNTCIVKQDELPLLGLDKDKVETKFLNKGGLPEFFML